MRKIVFLGTIFLTLLMGLEATAQEKKEEKEKSLRSRISEIRKKNSVKKEDLVFPFIPEPGRLSQKNRNIRLTAEETPDRSIRLTVEEITFDVNDFNSETYNRGYVLKTTSENGVLIKGVEQGVIWHLFVKVEGFEDNFAATPTNQRKSSADLQVRKKNTGVFLPVLSDPSGYGTEVARGRGTGLPLSFGLEYRWLINWTKFNPGKYNINLIYSLVAETPSINVE